MAAPETPFETPRACPFVALELDRDKRGDRPDYRHRCFAEPTPAPRSIAHQEAYCLSPNFSACPVFQDWAVRAAAHPVSAPGSSAASVPPVAAGMAAAAAAGEVLDSDASVSDVESEAVEPESAPGWEPVPAAPDTWSAVSQLPEDASVTPAGAEIAAAAAAATGTSPGFVSPPTFATTDWQSQAEEGQQLAAFDSSPDDPRSTYEPHDDAYSSYGAPDAGYPEPQDEPVTPAFVPPPTPPAQSQQSRPDAAATAAVPAFLAGRSSRPSAATTSASGAPPPPARPPSREEIVPTWEIDGRYGAEGPPQDQGGGNRLDGILTAIAVIAILGLGIAAVLFLPGLLSKGGSAATPRPSAAVSSLSPTAGTSGLVSFAPSIAPTTGPTLAPTTPASIAPVGSPRTYKIKAGDSLARIANKFGITVQDILDANSDISDPNNIFVGEIIVIPIQVAPSAAP